MANGRGIRAGRAFVELGVSDRLSAGLRRAQRRLRAFGKSVREVGQRISVAGAAAVSTLGAMVVIFAKTGDELEKMSQRTGISVEALSELGFAAEQSGADLETLENGVRTMQRAIADLGRGLSTQVDAFGALGLAMADLEGLSPEEQFKLIAERLSQVEDATKRAALAQQIFGRAGTRLLPLFEDGARGIEALQEEARRLGLTISSKTANDAARLGDAFNILRRVLQITAITIGSALGPALEAIAKRVTRIAIVTNEWIKENRAAVVTFAKIAIGVFAVGTALVGLGLLLSLVAGAFGGLAAITTTIAAVMSGVAAAVGALLSPFGLLVAAAAGGAVAFFRFSAAGQAALKFLGDRFALLSGIVGRTIGGIKDALAGGDVILAAKVLWAGLKLTFLEGTKEIRDTFADGLLIMRLAFVDTLGAMSRLWTRFASGVQGIWERTQNFLAKQFIELFGLFDSSLDVEEAQAQLERQSRNKLESLARETEDALREIDEKQDQRAKGLLDGAAEKMEERRKALEEARRKLDQALEEARRRREEADLGRTGPGEGGAPSFLDRFAELEEALAGAGESIANRAEARGTFNSLAAQGLAGGSRAIDRTADATEQTARNTKRLLELGDIPFAIFG